MRRSHQVVVTIAVATTTLGVALLVGAAERQRNRLDGRVGRQAVLTRDTSTTTTSTSFEEIPGLSNEVIKNRGVFTIVFSGEFAGGPVELRIRGAKPGPVTFTNGGPGAAQESSSHSFTFADKAANEGTCSTISAEWRSLDGSPVTLEEGSVVVTYRYVGDRRARGMGCV